ncbi:amidohydrolase family protein [Nocardioides humilatus]|uniref:Amidohydrolase family protein n=1 Tax=Nocardioides humilatus TaxID=2607660 RepID=A0A5B1L9U0_9ACTN|nr:amidohydrolase family protein [Nocardioides humilatus]KAA1416437.1 amidohydrolase family protein [Nocardioides humilatus]
MTRTVFTGGTVYDGTLAAPAAADVLVEDGRILEVGIGLDGDEAVDCSGAFVSPGFFDCHVHVMLTDLDHLRMMATPFSLNFFMAADNLRKTLAGGVTTVRDAGLADLGTKRAVETGLIPGPRMHIAVEMISQTGGHGDTWELCGTHVDLIPAHPGRPNGVADGVDAVRRKAREMIRSGADVLKVATSGGVMSPTDDPRHGQFTDAEVAALVEEAHAAGIEVMAHAQGTAGVKRAVRTGVRSIEHGIYLDDESIEMMLAAGTWLVPTMHAPQSVLKAAAAGVPIPATAVAQTQAVVAEHRASMKRAYQAGVRFAMGTDCGIGPHGTNLDELGYLVEIGMSPVEALHAATRSAAELLKVADDRGTLEPGKRADLVVVEGAVDDLTGVPGRIRGVYLDGRAV